MTKLRDGFSVTPFPRIRLPMVDGGRLGRRKHTIHGLAEFDITDTRRALREYRACTGASISLTAFILVCLGRALDEHKQLHAYRNWRNQLITFDDVDVITFFEVNVDGKKLIRPHVLRELNKRSFRDVHEEIRRFKTDHATSPETKAINYLIWLPGPLRRLFYWTLFKNPTLIKQYMGTVSVTALGMFGAGAFWGIPVPNQTLQITLGGVAEKPGIIDGHIAIRKYISVTISVDHDIVDGAPVVRFVNCFRRLIESGAVLADEV